MCLALVAFRALPEWPLFVAANRDEIRRRPSTSPARRDVEGIAILAPRDLLAGGTWVGVNDRGLLALITNRSDLMLAPPPAARSRGVLVDRMLGAATWADAVRRWEADTVLPSAPYNLFVGDLEKASILSWAGSGTPKREDLHPGVHAVSNHGVANDRRVGEIARAFDYWKHATSEGIDPWDAAKALLTIAHTEGGLPPILKRGADRGTVSATIAGIHESGNCRFLHADGPPDLAPWVEYSL